MIGKMELTETIEHVAVLLNLYEKVIVIANHCHNTNSNPTRVEIT